jgi:hypothetical protein
MALNGTITANRLIRVRWTVLNRDGMLEAIEMKPLLVHGSAKPGQCYT